MDLDEVDYAPRGAEVSEAHKRGDPPQSHTVMHAALKRLLHGT